MVIGSRLLRDRAIAGGMPRWKWLGNRHADRASRTAPSASQLLRVPHRLPRLLAPSCCARSRSCATPTTSSSTRRSSPRCWRAARAWSRSRSRRATSARPRASTCVTSIRYGVMTLGVLARFRSTAAAAAGRCCAAPPATSAPSARSDARRPRRRARRGARRAWRSCCASATSTTRPATRCATTRSTTTSTPRSIAQGDGFSKTLAHGRPTAFRPPGYPYFLGAVYHVFKADRKPVKERVHVARIAQALRRDGARRARRA